MASINTDKNNFDDINNKKNNSEDIEKNSTSDNKATTIAAVEKEATETVNGSKHKSGEIGNEKFNNPEDKNTDNKELGEKFFNFTFYKVDPKWRWLNEIGKEEASREFLELLNIASTKMRIRTYSTMGLRHESEFMIWTVSSSLENIQVLASKIYTTIIGKYIEPVSTYLSLTRKSIYSNQTRPGFETEDEPMPYVVVYPFIKSREWYLLPFEKRRQMMQEHIKVGRKYPEIRLNTTYSFGIDDQDFMLAFETPDLSRFQSLIMELRETKVSKYIIKDTPMIPCVLKNMGDIIKNIVLFSKDSFNFITNNHFDNKKYCNYNDISPSPSPSSNIDLNSEKISSSSLYHSKTSDHSLHSVPLQNHESNSSANFLGALKEWAIICKAIEDGRQILLFRKGGIMEFRNGFELKYKNFFLFPTFEHQAKESIRIEYHKELEELEKSDKLNTKKVDTVHNNNSTSTREITSFVEIMDFNEVKNIDDLEKLEQFHIWTDDYLKTRFNYNPKKPLYLLLLRAYKLDVPIRIIDKPEWVGCKSWIKLDPNDRDLTKYFKDHFSETSFEHLKSVSKPCIDDNKFNKLSKEVKGV